MEKIIGFIIGDGLSPTRLAREPESVDYSPSQGVWRGVLCFLDKIVVSSKSPSSSILREKYMCINS